MSNAVKKIEVEKLDDEMLEKVSAGLTLSPANYAEIGNALGNLVAHYIDKFTPKMPSRKALNIQALMQERMDAYIAGDMNTYNLRTRCLKLMGIDLDKIDQGIDEEVRKRLGK